MHEMKENVQTGIPIARVAKQNAEGRRPAAALMPTLDDEDLRRIVQAVRAVLNAEQSVSGAIGERWAGGQLVLKPGKAGTQDRRSRSRSSSASHPKLSEEDRAQVQDYITRA